jgi:hypothetical protein
LPAGAALTPTPQECQLWIVLEGAGTFGGQAFRQSEVWLFPETGEQPNIQTESSARFLRTYTPRR